MLNRRVMVLVFIASLCTAVVQLAGGTVIAQQATSNDYQVDEAFFGTGGELGDCSGTGANAGNGYCARMSTGNLAQGLAADAANPGNNTQGGNNTNREEYLEFIVNGVTTDLGVLTPGTPYTTTATFSVKNYLSTGYVVINAADPPRTGSNGHTLTTDDTTPAVYNSANERFGINLAANTSPTTFGAAPVQIPDATFSYGSAYSGYNTANQFKYKKGDYIAQSTRSSGQTNYTVSYLYNIIDTTPAGLYRFNHDLVAFPTY